MKAKTNPQNGENLFSAQFTMAINVRARRSTANILGDQAKARIVGGFSYGSSGSEHDAEDDSPCLSELVHGFLEDGEWSSAEGDRMLDDDSDSNVDESVDDYADEIVDAVRKALTGNVDSYRWLLHCHVIRAAEAFSDLRSDKNLFRRRVMSSLREIGHNAAICKTKWSSTGGLTAGNYEFIDVLLASSSGGHQIRYVIDLDFAGEFEVARPTDQYSRLLTLLPKVFVGKTDNLKKILRAMSDAARRTLKSKGLSLPPWRKNRYMQNKWLGPYRRTVNPSSSSSVVTSATDVKCRAVGFGGGINGGQVFVRT